MSLSKHKVKQTTKSFTTLSVVVFLGVDLKVLVTQHLKRPAFHVEHSAVHSVHANRLTHPFAAGETIERVISVPDDVDGVELPRPTLGALLPEPHIHPCDFRHHWLIDEQEQIGLEIDYLLEENRKRTLT